MLDRVGMAHRAKHYPAQLSGGQQQRIAVARALGGKPSILLADEPTGNLDSKNSEAVMDLLKELHREGATICMVTHDSRYAGIADRTIHLVDGRIVEETDDRPRRSHMNPFRGRARRPSFLFFERNAVLDSPRARRRWRDQKTIPHNEEDLTWKPIPR